MSLKLVYKNRKETCIQIYDIRHKDFYSSTSEKLLKDSLIFAKKHKPVSINDLKIIQHSRKYLSYKKGVSVQISMKNSM